MCFSTKQTIDKLEMKNRFKAELVTTESYQSEVFNGFDHPKTPIITNADPNAIQLFQWGLLPSWATDTKIQNMTLNARIETLREKPSFRDVLHQKCLVLVNGFYEWQWLDEKGKHKQKYLISLPNDEPFAMAGLYSKWKNAENELVSTYTIITTEAKGIMREIHNTKLRMPVILTQGNERPWLMGETRGDLNLGLVGRKV